MRLVRYHYPLSRNFGPLARSPWRGLEGEIDRLFENALTGYGTASSTRVPVDLYEDKDNTYVRAELPGVKREDINVELVEGQLNISAVRKTAASGDEPEQTYTVTRSVTVPDSAVQADRISAGYENGVLTVTLPKREESKPRKITVAVK